MSLTMKTKSLCRRCAAAGGVVVDRLRHHSALIIDADIRGLSYTTVKLQMVIETKSLFIRRKKLIKYIYIYKYIKRKSSNNLPQEYDDDVF